MKILLTKITLFFIYLYFSINSVYAQCPIIACPGNMTVNTTSGVCNAIVNYSTPIGTNTCIVAAASSNTFNFTGSLQTFSVPIGVTQITVDIYGAEGGDAIGITTGWSAGTLNISGGDGGRVVSVITTTPGEILNLYVGSKGTMTAGLGGYNGGGFISPCSGGEVLAAGGGGASDIRRLGIALSDRIIVAGGGGGAAGAASTYYSTNNSGAGGGLTAANSANLSNVLCVRGLGGSPLAGGSGGNNSCNCGGLLSSGTGSLGIGGSSICSPSCFTQLTCGGTSCTNGGGGGGGYYGGGAGISWCGGGGGSSYALASAISAVHTQGVNTGNGKIIITTPQVAAITPTTNLITGLTSGATFTLGSTVQTYSVLAGSSATCSFTVTVIDLQTPTITCPSSFTSCSVSIPSIAPISVIDNCALPAVSYTLLGATNATGVNNASGIYNLGTTIVTYKATDASGNNSSCSFSVTVAPIPTISISGPNIICANSNIILTASGANTYTWNTGTISSTLNINPPSNSSFSVIGKNTFGCSNIAVKSITVNPIPFFTITGANSICKGQFVNLNAIGNNLNYLWSTGSTSSSIAVSPTISTSYSLTGTNNFSCSSLQVLSINVNPLPTIIINAVPSNQICAGTSIVLTASGADTYIWSVGTSSTSINVSPTISSSYSVNGLSNSTNCFGTGSISITVNNCLSVKNILNNILTPILFPNPNNGIFNIQLLNGLNKTIEVSDISGRIIYLNSTSEDKIHLNLIHLANGIYYIKISSDSKIEIIKMIKTTLN